jgi:hypothetical protein
VTYPNPAEEIISTLLDSAIRNKREVARDDPLLPTIFFFGEDQTPFRIMGLMNPENMPFIEAIDNVLPVIQEQAQELRAEGRFHPASRIVLVNEVWISKQGVGRPSKDPNRQEAILLMIHDDGAEGDLTVTQYFTNTKGFKLNGLPLIQEIPHTIKAVKDDALTTATATGGCLPGRVINAYNQIAKEEKKRDSWLPS